MYANTEYNWTFLLTSIKSYVVPFVASHVSTTNLPNTPEKCKNERKISDSWYF